MIDLKKIAEQVDRLLETETTESLNAWLKEHRRKQRIWNKEAAKEEAREPAKRNGYRKTYLK